MSIRARARRMRDAARRTAGRQRGITVGGPCYVHPSLRSQFGDVRLGANCRVYPNVFIRGPRVRIGNGVFLNTAVYIGGDVTVEDEVSVGPGVQILTDTHDMSDPSHRAGDPGLDPVVIGRGSWIGGNVTVLPGVTVGAGSVIGAGSVVTRSTEPNSLYIGVPARKVRNLPT